MITPGDWRVEAEDQALVVWAHPYEYDIYICEIADPPRDLAAGRYVGTMTDNARAVASVPALLAALQWIVDHGDTTEGWRPACHAMRARARQAIAAATGE